MITKVFPAASRTRALWEALLQAHTAQRKGSLVQGVHTHRLQSFLLPSALALPVDKGACREFVMVQQADDDYHHNSYNHDYNDDLNKLQFS